jgi:hypothetical protein
VHGIKTTAVTVRADLDEDGVCAALIAFGVVRIGPQAGMIATRLSGFVRLAREVVRPGGSHVGSQGPLPFQGSSRPGRRVWARWRIASSR